MTAKKGKKKEIKENEMNRTEHKVNKGKKKYTQKKEQYGVNIAEKRKKFK